MKKIFFVALAATLLAASCQKTEIINHVGDAMAFSTELGKLTKAGDDATTAAPSAESTGEANLQAQNFRVWVYNRDKDPNTGADALSLYDNMGNSPVTYTPASGWKTDKEYYWPGKDKFLKFFAVSADEATLGSEYTKYETSATAEEPAAPGTTTVPTKISISEDRTKLTINGFQTINTAPDTDLMVADFVEQSQNSKTQNQKSVDLNFRHALSKVEFLFKTSANSTIPVWVQSVTVSNINTKADLDVTDVAGSCNFAWKNRTAPQSFTDDYTMVDGVDTNPAVQEGYVAMQGVTVDDQAMILTGSAKKFATWLVIPQDVIAGGTDNISATLKVDVVYVMGLRQFKASFDLDAKNQVPTWSPNQYVKYTITLAPNLITFVPSVQPWAPSGSVEDGQTEEVGKEVVLGDGDTEAQEPATPATYVELGTIGEGDSAVTYFYTGELAENTQLYVKEGDNYIAAGNVTHTFELTDKTVVVENGTVKTITPKTTQN